MKPEALLALAWAVNTCRTRAPAGVKPSHVAYRQKVRLAFEGLTAVRAAVAATATPIARAMNDDGRPELAQDHAAEREARRMAASLWPDKVQELIRVNPVVAGFVAEWIARGNGLEPMLWELVETLAP